MNRLFCAWVLGLSLIGVSDVFSQEQPAANGLTVAARAMEKYLNSLEPTAQSQWKTHFNWDAWGPALTREENPDREVVEAVLPKFYGFGEGLDQAEYLRMRSELKSFLQGTDAPAPIGVHPSFYVRIDKSLIDSRLEKRSKTLELHRETGNQIAGAWVTGDAFTHVDAKAHVIDLHGRAAIEVQLTGLVQTPHTVASARRFHVHGSSTSPFNGVAHILLDKDGFKATSPLIIAQTNSQLSHVDGPRPFRRIAMRAAQKRSGQGEMEGAEIIRQTVKKEFKAELDKEVAKLNEKFSDYEKYWVMLKRADIAPTQVAMTLQQGALELGLCFTDSGADVVHAMKPRLTDGSFEIVMHETFLSAFPRRFLKGVWWKAEDFERTRKELAGIPIDSEEPPPSLEPWSARWDAREPIAISITPENIDCKLHFSHAGIADQWVKDGIVVSLKFLPVVAGAHIELRRVGDVSVEARSPNETLTEEQAAFFARKFTELSGEAIALERLHPPAGLSATALALFTTSNVELEQGWMNVRYRKGEGVIPKIVSELKK